MTVNTWSARALDDAGPWVVVLVHAVTKTHQLVLARLHRFDVARDAILGADLIQHAQDFFVRSAVQGASERRSRGSHAKIWIGLRAADAAHRVGGTVLLVVGVQNEKDVEGALQNRIGDILRLEHLPHHVHEIPREAQLVVRVDVGQAEVMPVAVARKWWASSATSRAICSLRFFASKMFRASG